MLRGFKALKIGKGAHVTLRANASNALAVFLLREWVPGCRYGKVKDFKLVRRGDERSALIEYINLDDAIRWYPSTLQYP